MRIIACLPPRLLAAAALALLPPAIITPPAAASIGFSQWFVGVDALRVQRLYAGCDRCMPQLVFQDVQFCSEAGETCLWEWGTCPECNAVCSVYDTFTDGSGMRWQSFTKWLDPDGFDREVTRCRQHVTDRYFENGAFIIWGAYLRVTHVGLGSLQPPVHRDYADLESDAAFRNQLDGMNVDGPPEGVPALELSIATIQATAALCHWFAGGGVAAGAEAAGPVPRSDGAVQTAGFRDPEYYRELYDAASWCLCWHRYVTQGGPSPTMSGWPDDRFDPDRFHVVDTAIRAVCGTHSSVPECGITPAGHATWGAVKRRYR